MIRSRSLLGMVPSTEAARVSGSEEPLGDQLGVRDGHAERDGRASFGMVAIMLDRVADDRTVRHQLGERADRVVAGDLANARQVEPPGRGEHAHVGEEASVDQFLDRGPADQRIEALGEALVVEPLGRRGYAQKVGVGVAIEHVRPAARDCMMTLVDDDQVGVGDRLGPARQRLDTATWIGWDGSAGQPAAITPHSTPNSRSFSIVWRISSRRWTSTRARRPLARTAAAMRPKMIVLPPPVGNWKHTRRVRRMVLRMTSSASTGTAGARSRRSWPLLRAIDVPFPVDQGPGLLGPWPAARD